MLTLAAILAIFLLPVGGSWAARSAGLGPVTITLKATNVNSGATMLSFAVRPRDAILLTFQHPTLGGRVQERYQVHEDGGLRLVDAISDRRAIVESYRRAGDIQESGSSSFIVTVPGAASPSLRIMVDAITRPLISHDQRSWDLFLIAEGPAELAVVSSGR